MINKFLSKNGFWVLILLIALSIINQSCSTSRKALKPIILTDTLIVNKSTTIRDTVVKIVPETFYITDSINCPDIAEKTVEAKGGKVTYSIKNKVLKVDCKADSITQVLKGVIIERDSYEKKVVNDVRAITGLNKFIESQKKEIDKLNRRKDFYKSGFFILLMALGLIFVIFKAVK